MKEIHKRLRGMSKVLRGEKGFTMIELAMVLVVIGILAAVAVPTYQSMVNKAHTADAKGILSEIKTAAWTYYLENDAWPSSLSDLGVETDQSEYDTFEVQDTSDDAVFAVHAEDSDYPTVELILNDDGSSEMNTGSGNLTLSN